MAEIAVGLAGFSGIVAAFSQTGMFQTADRVRFLLLVGGTFFVMILAFVPFLLSLAGMQEPAVWRWASGIWFVGMTACSPLVVAGRNIIVKQGQVAPGWSVAIVGAAGVLSAIVQLFNVFGWPYHPGPVPFLIALLAGLLGSAVIFVYLVLIRTSEQPRERAPEGVRIDQAPILGSIASATAVASADDRS